MQNREANQAAECVLKIIVVIFVLCGLAQAQLLYTPFKGYGASATGGTNVVTVTNRNDTGAGSLRACATVARNWCKFTGLTGGTITVANSIMMADGVTIDGFTAAGIITISGTSTSGYGCLTTGANDIIQGIRVSGCSEDNIHIAGDAAHDIVIDHCVLNSPGDGNLDITEGAYNVTLSWSLLENASHNTMTKYEGATLLARKVTYHHNLMVNNDARNPWLDAGNDGTGVTTPNVGIMGDIRWNVIGGGFTYGIVFQSDIGVTAQANIVGNLLLDDYGGYARNAINMDAYSTMKAYIAGNAYLNDPGLCGAYGYNNAPFCRTAQANILDCTKADASGTATGFAPGSCQSATPYATPTVSGPCVTDNAARITEWTNVKATAGVYPFTDDATDATARAAITIPAVSLLSQSWNTQTGSCVSVVPASPGSLVVVVQ